MNGGTITLASGVTTVVAQTGVLFVPGPNAPKSTGNTVASIQAVIVGTGAVGATILIQVSNDNANWITYATVTLSGTTTATDGITLSAPWLYIRSNVTAISGTAATVGVTAGIV